MALHKFEAVDGFVVSDVADVPRVGILRVGRKILQSSSYTLARWATYTMASAGLDWSGAAVGVNAEGDDQEPAVQAALDELSGLDHPPLLLPWHSAIENHTVLSPVSPDDVAGATAASVAAATAWAIGGSVDGATVAIEGTAAGHPPDGLDAVFTAAGATLVEPDPERPWAVDVDALIVGSKPGVLTHTQAEEVQARAVVPWGPVPITTRALAVLAGRSTVYVPDFISAAGGLLTLARAGGADVEPDETLDRVRADLEPVATDGGGLDDLLFLRAANRAEEHMRSRRPKVPFGRPLV